MSAGTNRRPPPAGPVAFVAVDLYERMLHERDADPKAYAVKYSPVARAAAEAYERARRLAVGAAGRRNRRVL